MAKTTSSYTKATTADGVKFAVTPASSPSAGFSIMRGILCAIAAWMITNMAALPIFFLLGQQHWLSVGLVAIGFFFLWYKFSGLLKRWIVKKENKVRQAFDTEVIVTRTGLLVPARKLSILHSDMHRLVIRNAYDKHMEIPMSHVAAAGSPVMVGSAIAANAMTSTIAISYNNKLKALAEVSYQVTAEAGGTSNIVAGGLTEVCAFGLMSDIDRALNNQAH